jgi:uncharacterized protein (UPF0548 family)
VFLIRRPDEEAARRFLDGQRSQPFSYPERGATGGDLPRAGYDVDHNRVRLGAGREAFERASAAVRRWRMFDLGWAEILWPSAPIEPGTTVAMLARFSGVWSLNAARIVYVVAEERRFGFAYGTLPDHVERGEERFLVEILADGSVWYELLAFSRPRHWTARAGYPLVRRLQRRFVRDSMAAMVRAVA